MHSGPLHVLTPRIDTVTSLVLIPLCPTKMRSWTQSNVQSNRCDDSVIFCTLQPCNYLCFAPVIIHMSGIWSFLTFPHSQTVFISLHKLCEFICSREKSYLHCICINSIMNKHACPLAFFLINIHFCWSCNKSRLLLNAHIHTLYGRFRTRQMMY